MPHDYEYMSQGINIYEEERKRKEAQKKNICDFVNRLDNYQATLLKTIKNKYKQYSVLNETITHINDQIKKNTDELNSVLTIRQSTKDRLNQQLTDLREQLEEVQYHKLVVESHFDNYRNIDRRLSIFDFFSALNTCEIIPHARAEVVGTNARAEVLNTKSNDVAVAEATRIKNKYLKYKQKYLSLKNKLN